MLCRPAVLFAAYPALLSAPLIIVIISPAVVSLVLVSSSITVSAAAVAASTVVVVTTGVSALTAVVLVHSIHKVRSAGVTVIFLVTRAIIVISPSVVIHWILV